ncbi:MAG: hypothetical protein AABY83_05965 [Pseudomonadota bacterium]
MFKISSDFRHLSFGFMLLISACGGGGSTPTPAASAQSPTILEILRRDVTGTLIGVAGIEVLHNDATTGVYIDSKITDAAGRTDFGVLAGPTTLSIVRIPPASGGPTRAYTLLGLPEGTTARVRLDRLPLEPAAVLATVNVALSPALNSTERAYACLPGDCIGDATMARPNATAFANVPITDHDIQDDGLVTLLAGVLDDEMGTLLGCRPYADFAVPANGATVPASVSTSVIPGTMPTSGALGLRRVLALRKGVTFPLYAWETRPTCAFAFSSGIIGGSSGAVTGAGGFSLQGAVAVGSGTQQVTNYFQERSSAEKRGALWINGPTLPVAPQTLPTANATIEALSYDAGALHFTLKGTEVRPLIAARASIIWSPTGAVPGNVLPTSGATDIRAWYLYSGLAVKPASCDGTSADPDCSFAVKLPDLSALGTPPAQSNGAQMSVEAAALTGAANADHFWRMLAAEGDVEAVLARGYSGAYRDSALWKLNFKLSIGDYITNSANYKFGKVTGPGGIDCGGPQHPYYTVSCDATFSGGTPVTLTAIPNSGAEFVEWAGRCTLAGAATNASITFALDKDQSCVAKFQPIPGSGSKSLNLTEPQGANGLITSDDGFLSCGWDIQGFPQSQCSFNYSSGFTAVLSVARTSNTGTGYTVAWTGDCAGATGTSTTIVMSADRSCGVTYTPVTP